MSNFYDNFECPGIPDSRFWSILNYCSERKVIPPSSITVVNGSLQIVLQTAVDAPWIEYTLPSYTGYGVQTVKAYRIPTNGTVTVAAHFLSPPSLGTGYSQSLAGLSITNSPMGPADSPIPYTAPNGIYFDASNSNHEIARGRDGAFSVPKDKWVMDGIWNIGQAAIGTIELSFNSTTYTYKRNGITILNEITHGINLSEFWIQVTLDSRSYGTPETVQLSSFSLLNVDCF